MKAGLSPSDIPNLPMAEIGQPSLGTTIGTRAVTAAVPDRELPLRDKRRYKFISRHASGGLGRIWRVYDLDLHREVAFKELLTVNATTKTRFFREAFATAQLEHPSIVPIHDAGCSSDGEPFYTMKLVQGQTLSLATHGRSLPERLHYLPRILAVAEAIAYAHSRGVLHRDIKPDNVLVGDFGETVVIDWGLAKVIDDDVDEPAPRVEEPISTQGLTTLGAVLGTPAYMPPEQARGMEVNERADIYSLGAMMYFVVSGRAPFAGKNSDEIVQAVKDAAPPSLKSVEPKAPPELVSIVERAMARNPSERFESARAFADDLARYLSKETVQSHRYSWAAKAWRLVQRHKGAATAAAIALVVLALLTAAATVRESSLRRAAEFEGERARRSTQTLLEQQGRAELATGHPLKAAVYFAEALQRQPADLPLRYLLSQSLKPVASKQLELKGHTKDVVTLDYSPDGRWLVTGSSDATVRLWDVSTGAQLRILGEHQKGLDAVRFTPDGKTVITADIGNQVHFTSAETGVTWLQIEEPNSFRIAVSPDGNQVILGGQSGDVTVRDAQHGSLLATLKQHTGRAAALTLSPNGSELYVGSWDKSVSVWSLATFKRLRLLTGFESEISSIAVSDDGEWVAIAEADSSIHILRRNNWEKSHTIRTPVGARWPLVTFSNQDHVLLANSHDGRVSAYHSSSGQLLASVDVTPEGKMFSSALPYHREAVAVAGLLGSVTVWSLKEVFDFDLLPMGVGFRKEVLTSRFLSNTELLTSTEDGKLSWWELPSKTLKAQFDVGPEVVRLAPRNDNGQLMFNNFKRPHRQTTVLDMRTGSIIKQLPHPGLISDVEADWAGARYASACYDGTVRIFNAGNLETLAEIHLDNVRISSIAWHPSGKQIAASDEFGKVYFIELDSHKVVKTLEAHSTWIQDMAFFSDGVRLATAGRQDHQVRVWNLDTGVRLLNLTQHQNNVMDVSVSADGRLLATAALDHQAHLFEVSSGRLLRTFTGAGYSAQFSPDGNKLLTTGYNGYAVLWNIVPDARTPEALSLEVASRAPWKLVESDLSLVRQ